MTRISLQTPAKVNLCLRVLGRRDDGYHNVETVLHTIGLWDRVSLSRLPEPGRIELQVEGEPAPADDTNLCWRAAARLAERARTGAGVRIALCKTIPVGAGLGGASSDAAATLLGLTRLWNLALTQDELEGVGGQVGADVPFFLRRGCCLARGRGERLQDLPPLAAWLVVVVPARRVATAQAYAALQRGASRGRRRALTRPAQRMTAALQEGRLAVVAAALHNDFEALRIAGIEDALQAAAALREAGCLGASVSGSGSGVFGLAPGRAEAERVASEMGAVWPWVRAVPTLRREESLLMSEVEEAS